jgi:hypothetical protein
MVADSGLEPMGADFCHVGVLLVGSVVVVFVCLLLVGLVP